MDKRRFGVEIECGIDHPDKYDSYDGTNRFIQGRLREAGLARWGDGIGYDGTEIEIRSPILQGPSGISELKEAMAVIVDSGGFITGADGMHTHHEAREFRGNKELQVRLVESWAANQDQINKMLHENRHFNGYCAPWTREEIDRLKAGGHGDGGRAISLRQLQQYGHGTIEIRQHQGCLDGDMAEDWIKFGQAFIRSVLKRKRPIATCSDPEVLLKRVRVAPKALEKIALRAKGQAPFNEIHDPDEYDTADEYAYDDYDPDW